MSDSKVSITITNRAPGLQPPLYVAGSFSNPEWVPEPMEYTTSEDGVHTFTKTLRVKSESRIVYKFRAGEGDWWLLNEDAPTVTDDAGNRNNVLEAPKATITNESEEPTAETAQTNLTQESEPSAKHTPQDTKAYSEIEEPKNVPQVEALKQSAEVDPARSSTPDFIKTVTEVAESAALLDRSTPEPGAPEAVAEKNGEQLSTLPLSNAADTAAEVADSAALLDGPSQEPETEIEADATSKGEGAPSDVAAEVADSAALLDHPNPDADSAEVELDATGKTEEIPSEVAAQVADTAETLDTEEKGEAPAEVAAQVADTAAKLDNEEPEAHPETTSPAYKTLADVKGDMKDESLDIAGYSNDQEPVPLFAHECAGLYEDDEIPGADEQGPSSSGGRPFEDDKEDYDDPTLERFPSTREEIMSTVRKVGTGLNADQVSVEAVPLSPVVHARSSPTAEARNEPPALDASPISRAQQHLPLPPSLTTTDGRALSVTSLHSIAEDAEGAEEDEAVEPKSENIADVVEKSNGVDETSVVATKTEAETNDESMASEIAPVVEQAETADEVIQVAQKAEGEHNDATALTSEDRPVVVDVTPAVEDIASVVELSPAAQDIASVVEQRNGADEGAIPSTKASTENVQNTEGNDVAPLNEEAKTETEASTSSKRTDASTSLATHKPDLESLVTIPSPSVKPSIGLLSPVSDDDEAVVVKSTKGKDEIANSGYLTPERATTPQHEDPGSPREPAPNTADPIPKSDLGSPVSKADVDEPLTEPRSPQIVVSNPEETQADKELLPAAILGGALDESDHAKDEASEGSETLNGEQNAKANQVDHSSKEVKVPDDVDTLNNAEAAAAPLDTETSENIDAHQASKDTAADKGIEDPAEVGAPQDDQDRKASEAPTDLEAPRHMDESRDTEPPESDKSSDNPKTRSVNGESPNGVGTSDVVETPAIVTKPHNENTATTSATEENSSSTLKQRSVARPNQADRTNTPISIPDSHKEAAKGGNWFSSFLRLIFIDFFGGLVRKIYGGGRETLVTAAVVLVAVGYASLRRAAEAEEQVVSY